MQQHGQKIGNKRALLLNDAFNQFSSSNEKNSMAKRMVCERQTVRKKVHRPFLSLTHSRWLWSYMYYSRWWAMNRLLRCRLLAAS
jgi:hypothetical protein